MTWLYFLNYFILQWFFVRLMRINHINDKTGEIYKTDYRMLYYVYPMTGWHNEYKYIFKKRDK